MPAQPLFGRVLSATAAVAEHAYPAGLTAESHFHDHSYISIVLGGACTERFAGRVETLAAGSVHLMVAGERHRNDYGADTRCLHIEVDRYLAGDAAPGPLRDPRAPILGHVIAGEFHRHDDVAPLAIEGLLFALFAPEARTADAQPPWLARVTGVLHDAHAQKLTVAQLAIIAGVHPGHLCREFHRRTGRTIGAYVRELRVARARALLARSEAPLAEIALACGFADQSHFATTFRRIMRVTPGKYRRMSR